MTGLELIAKIHAKEIENGTKIKAIKKNGDTVNLEFRDGGLIWKPGTFSILFLFNRNVQYEVIEAKGWFKPKDGETFWYIDYDGDTYSDNDFDSKFYGDKYKVEIHNCFRSEEEAREYLGYKKALREAEKPFKTGQLNYGMFYNFSSKKIDIFWNGDCVRQGTSYLGQDEEVVQAFIDKWKDCILKYEFDIWE